MPISVDLIKTETKLITNFTTKVNQKKAIKGQNKCMQNYCEKIKLNKSRLVNSVLNFIENLVRINSSTSS